jgi:hypothetical protein
MIRILFATLIGLIAAHAPAVADDARSLRPVATIDCAQDYSPEKYFGFGDVRVVHATAGAYREAGADPNSRFGYRFQVQHVGRPHLAVIRYPDDKTRCMSISDGTCYDLSIGVFTGRAKPHGKYTGLAQPLSGKMLEARQYFWPRWADCSIVLGNTTAGEPAAAAQVTIFEVDALSPLEVFEERNGSPRRSLGVSYEDPCSHAADLGATTFDTWLDRMVTFVKYSGMKRLTYPVIWYHGPLYPSPTETPNYFDWSVASPVNRNLYIRWTTQPGDWVEQLLRRFDQERLEFVSQVTYIRLPSLMQQMNTDLAAIQAGADTINNLRADDRVQSGAGDWTGEYNVRNFERQKIGREQGKRWVECPLLYGEQANGGGAKGPIFNPLHPKVQAALLRSVREIAARYGKHPSYKGLSIFCYGSSTLGFGSLRFGYDDLSIRRFEQETGVKVPVDMKLPDRFSKRYAFLTGRDVREKWITWRCEKITDLLRRMHDELVAVRADLRLTIAGAGSREAGIDAAAIGRLPGVSLIAGLNGLSPCADSTPAAGDPEVANIFNTWIERWGKHRWWSCDPQDAQARELAVIMGRPAEGMCRMGSEYPQDGFWWPNAQLRITPAFSGGVHFMRHYANAVARFDPLVLSRGGLTLDRGHADLVRPFALAYRALPAKKFETLGPSTDPVAVRTLVDEGRRYLYLVNREYYPIGVELRLTSPAGKATNLATGQAVDVGPQWKVTLGPYEMQSFALAPESQVAGFTAAPSPDVVAQLTREAAAVLEKIRAGRSAGGRPSPNAAQIRTALEEGRLAALRQLLESVPE